MVWRGSKLQVGMSKTEKLSSQPIRKYSAPARVNLIGEHTDYTAGLVLPMAIPFRTVASIMPNHQAAYEFSSDIFPARRVLRIADPTVRIGDWSDYCAGVFEQLRNRGIEISPFCLHITGNVPVGAGLSSSASVEIATAMALLAHAATILPIEEIALLCQRAENEFVGSPCGIMDQFVIAAAAAGHALLLHTDDLQYELLSLRKGRLADTRVLLSRIRQ